MKRAIYGYRVPAVLVAINLLILPFALRATGLRGDNEPARPPALDNNPRPPPVLRAPPRPYQAPSTDSPATNFECGPQLRQARNRIEGLRKSLLTEGDLEGRFLVAGPTDQNETELVSRLSERVLSPDGGLAVPHTVECRAGVCKILMFRPPEQALTRWTNESPCNSKDLASIREYVTGRVGIAIMKTDPVTGTSGWEDTCYIKLRKS
jgi:hypothetical protein